MLFIVGCARSGTSWVRDIFRAHDQVVTTAESHLFPVLYGPLTRSGLVEQRREEVLDTYDRSARDEIFPRCGPDKWIDRQRLCELLDAYVIDTPDDGGRDEAARRMFETVIHEYAISRGAGSQDLVVEKTPSHLYYAKKILGWWPRARIVEVLRDGRDVCISLEDKARVTDWAPGSRAAQIRTWVRAVRTGSEFRRLPEAQNRWHLVRYEDLIARPSAEIHALLEFAGLPSDQLIVESIVERTDFARLPVTGAGEHHRKGMIGDHQNNFSDDDHELFRTLAGDAFEEAGYIY